jgi:hypothetical protein
MNRPLLSNHPAANRHSPSHPPLFLSPKPRFPILVPFVFNRLRTLLQLGGGGGWGSYVGLSSRPEGGICFFFRSLPPFLITSSIFFIFFVFTFFQTLLPPRKSQLFSFQAIPNSFTKAPGVVQGPTSHSSDFGSCPGPLALLSANLGVLCVSALSFFLRLCPHLVPHPPRAVK